MSESNQYTVCELIEMACQEPGRRSRVLKRRMRRNADFKMEFEDEITEQLATDPRAMSLVPAFGLSSFDKDVPFELDTGSLREILDLILEYAPRIMEIITMLISLF